MLLANISEREVNIANLGPDSYSREMLLESIDVIERNISNDKHSAIVSRIEDKLNTLLSLSQPTPSNVSSSFAHGNGERKNDYLHLWYVL